MAIRTVNQIRNAVLYVLRKIGLRGHEIIWSDEDQYNSYIRSMGAEPTAEQLWPAGSDQLAGQCQSGALGNRSVDVIIESYRQYGLPESAMEEYEREARGKIFFYIDNISRQIYTEMQSRQRSSIEFKRITKIVTYYVAHERRHEVQPESMLDLRPVSLMNPDEYLNLQHESDAHEFGLAVLRGDANINNPAAWEPERLVA